MGGLSVMGKSKAAGTGGGTYPMGTKEEAAGSLGKAKKDLTPEEYAALLKKVCKKYPELDVCKKSRNSEMNDKIRQGFGRGPATAEK
jgi:hypothetical protein